MGDPSWSKICGSGWGAGRLSIEELLCKSGQVPGGGGQLKTPLTTPNFRPWHAGSMLEVSPHKPVD
jgi:hypothetical protein